MNDTVFSGQVSRKAWNHLRRHRDRYFPDETMEFMLEHAIRFTVNRERPPLRKPVCTIRPVS